MASYGGLTVVLAVVFRNEQLTSAQWVGVALTTSGIVLAALVLDDGIRKARPVSAGVAFALIACLGFAFATVGLRGTDPGRRLAARDGHLEVRQRRPGPDRSSPLRSS